MSGDLAEVLMFMVACAAIFGTILLLGTVVLPWIDRRGDR